MPRFISRECDERGTTTPQLLTASVISRANFSLFCPPPSVVPFVQRTFPKAQFFLSSEVCGPSIQRMNWRQMQTTFSLFYLLQCIIQYDRRTLCKAQLAALPQAQEVSLHLDSDANQGVSPYLVPNVDGACFSHVHRSLSTFLAQCSH